MSARRPMLEEPVVISEFWKNRRHDAIVVSLSTFEGRVRDGAHYETNPRKY